MVKVLTSDLLIADFNIRLQTSPRLSALVDKYKYELGEKYSLTEEQFQEFSVESDGTSIIPSPGGSSANTLTTLSKLLGDEMQGSFLGVLGKSSYSTMIKSAMEQAKIEIFPKSADLPAEPSPRTAVSHVMINKEGQRIIATYPGNARQLLKLEHITKELVQDSDAIFVQGSMWEKFDEDFANRLVTLRWDYSNGEHRKNGHGKELWLALPTHADFGEKNKEHFEWLIPSSNVVLANEKELARILGTGKDYDAALKQLQWLFKNRNALKKNGWVNYHQVGYITLGDKGTAVVTEEDIRIVPSEKVVHVENDLGAGDTAFAGFLYGHIKGLDPLVSAEIGNKLAAKKLEINAARLPDPLAALNAVMPSRASEFSRRGTIFDAISREVEFAKR